MRTLLALLMLAVLTSSALAQRAYDTDILRETFGFDESTKHAVPLEDLHQGCAARDCIRSLENPTYVAAGAADHVADDDLVIGIRVGEDRRAFPTRILDRHEIVNDTIGGEPIAITWCPLCGSAVGIRRDVAGTETEFGVSGLLYNSDLVFYDRATETLWDQIEARGIVGPLTGHELELVPVTMARWSQWRDAHPDTIVLSADTGFGIDYSRDPYARYRNSDGLMFPVKAEDDRMRPKSVVFGFDIDGEPIAFAKELLDEEGRIEHEFAGQAVTVTMHDDGSVRLVDPDGKVHAPIRLFWFAWYTFHPETELVR